jgi:hypothetical protein
MLKLWRSRKRHTLRDALRRARRIVRRHVQPWRSLSAELIEERRVEEKKAHSR